MIETEPAFKGCDREVEGRLDQEKYEKIFYYDCLIIILPEERTPEELKGEGGQEPKPDRTPPRCLQPLHLMEPDSTETNEWME
jgi:hypothetical protein